MLWLSRWVISKVIRNCFSFALPRYLIGSKKLTQLSRLIRFQTKYNITRFSALQTVCFQFSSVQFLVLFPSFLWAVEITLILDSYTFFKTLSKVHRIMNWWSLLIKRDPVSENTGRTQIFYRMFQRFHAKIFME